MDSEKQIELTLDEAQDIIDEYQNSNTLLHALNDAKTIEQLPEDLGEFVQKINDTLPDDYVGACEKLMQLSKSDPEFFNQIVMFQMISKDLKFEEPNIQKVSKDDIASAQKNS